MVLQKAGKRGRVLIETLLYKTVFSVFFTLFIITIILFIIVLCWHLLLMWCYMNSWLFLRIGLFLPEVIMSSISANWAIPLIWLAISSNSINQKLILFSYFFSKHPFWHSYFSGLDQPSPSHSLPKYSHLWQIFLLHPHIKVTTQGKLVSSFLFPLSPLPLLLLIQGPTISFLDNCNCPLTIYPISLSTDDFVTNLFFLPVPWPVSLPCWRFLIFFLIFLC